MSSFFLAIERSVVHSILASGFHVHFITGFYSLNVGPGRSIESRSSASIFGGHDANASERPRARDCAGAVSLSHERKTIINKYFQLFNLFCL